jgi:hypothetical protein
MSDLDRWGFPDPWKRLLDESWLRQPSGLLDQLLDEPAPSSAPPPIIEIRMSPALEARRLRAFPGDEDIPGRRGRLLGMPIMEDSRLPADVIEVHTMDTLRRIRLSDDPVSDLGTVPLAEFSDTSNGNSAFSSLTANEDVAKGQIVRFRGGLDHRWHDYKALDPARTGEPFRAALVVCRAID